MSNSEYLPSNTLAFQKLTHNVRDQVALNSDRWDISPTAAGELDAPIEAFDAAVAISENPDKRTSASVTKRDETRADLEKVLRPFIQGKLVHNTLVTDDDLVAMGLPVRDHKPSPAPDPTEEPEVTVSTPAPAIIEVAVRGKHGKGRGKPKGVHGAELRWIVADTAPVDWSELLHSEFITRSPFRLTFSGHERGKWIYFAARWENTRGVKGPWTDIMNAVIP